MARLKRSAGFGSLAPEALRLLTAARDLQRRKGRERRSLFLAEGVRAAEEVVRARVSIRGAVVSPQLEESARGRSLLHALEQRAQAVARVSERDLTEVAGTETPQGVVLVAETPSVSLASVRLGQRAVILVLDGVQDPGNTGTILRTAAALGCDAVVALPGTVDLWNPKVVRGAMGAHFHVPSVQSEPEDLFAWLDEQRVPLLVSDARGEPVSAATLPPRVAVALGNEGAGVSAALRERASGSVTLPLQPGVESLNVAVAAGIILYLLREPRPAS